MYKLRESFGLIDKQQRKVDLTINKTPSIFQTTHFVNTQLPTYTTCVSPAACMHPTHDPLSKSFFSTAVICLVKQHASFYFLDL